MNETIRFPLKDRISQQLSLEKCVEIQVCTVKIFPYFSIFSDFVEVYNVGQFSLQLVCFGAGLMKDVILEVRDYVVLDQNFRLQKDSF